MGYNDTAYTTTVVPDALHVSMPDEFERGFPRLRTGASFEKHEGSKNTRVLQQCVCLPGLDCFAGRNLVIVAGACDCA